MILTPAQAEAVYRAMCELNNIGGRIDARIGYTRVNETVSVGILVTAPGQSTEQHNDQAAFAAAYGLQ